MDYKPNSHKSKEDPKDEKKITPVVRGNVTVKKESVGHKFADTFLAETVQNTGKYMINEVVIPAIVDTIVDALTSGISMLFKGSPTSTRRKSSNGRTNYSSFSRGGGSSSDRERDRDERRFSRDRYGLLDIIFDTRGDALEVRDCLYEVMDKYHVVSVSDYYELSKAGDQATYTDRKNGWYELGDMQITRDRDGFRIKMPRVESLD